MEVAGIEWVENLCENKCIENGLVYVVLTGLVCGAKVIDKLVTMVPELT